MRGHAQDDIIDSATWQWRRASYPLGRSKMGITPAHTVFKVTYAISHRSTPATMSGTAAPFPIDLKQYKKYGAHAQCRDLSALTFTQDQARPHEPEAHR